MKYAIITGASKGLGEGIAHKMLEENINVIAISRTENEELRTAASNGTAEYSYYPCDLTSANEIRDVFSKVSEAVFHDQSQAVYLINNAGVVDPIETVGELEEAAVLRNIQVNLTAPILITNLFVKAAEERGKRLVIANVTSGAAERPSHGWSIYCSTKAAINMFTETAALEFTNKLSQTVIFGYSPGIMDTGMQETIRSSSKEAFSEIERFKEFKEKGMLRPPSVVANALVKLILEKSIEIGKVYHVNDLL
ncbi:(S)-benzoin forming benzil reductase [Mesobacillus foraminis]|uniref:Benzil reductase ((S)-benzoin forming) n=1 Tax=Mesobacillus foraminis TaxID=279826 RepID=A0A4R2BL34_9BACI|nr:(S)-benzoin forming benzil reductase [Mesobacillus foraminis]TCN26869.1 benzil reductase ((S)-benzoin forming) [Mesobacillus foraminis]